MSPYGMDVTARRRSSIAPRLLLGAGLALSGCASARPDPNVVMSEPPQASFLDRVLRRQPAASNYTSTVAETPRDPKDPGRLSLAYARLMEEAGKLDEAETHYSKALEEHPDSVDALVGLGRVHTLAGRHDQAEQTLLRAFKQQPQSAAVLHGLGQSYAARAKWDEAVEVLHEASSLEPANTTIEYDLAVALVQAGDVDAALPHFVRTVGDAEAHYNIGLILQRSGRLTESEQQFRVALAKKPDFSQAQQWLETLRAQQSLPAVPPTMIADGATPPYAATNAVQPVGYTAPQPRSPVW